MRLTTKGRYAVTAMLDLALHADKAPVSLSDIASRQSISLSYLEQLFSLLRKQGLVISARGPGGGYQLSRAGEEIYVSNIIDAVDESIDATGCKGTASCQGGEECLTHHLWIDLSRQIHGFLNEISLENLLHRREIKRVSDRQEARIKIRSSVSNIAVS